MRFAVYAILCFAHLLVAGYYLLAKDIFPAIFFTAGAIFWLLAAYEAHSNRLTELSPEEVNPDEPGDV